MQYFELKFTAIVGGALKSTQELLDRVLMINSLIDTASHIHIYGEVGLAALYSLGFKVGRVERTSDNCKDYEAVKSFFHSIFEKAAMKCVKIMLPLDFKVSEKIELSDDQVLGEQQQNLS